LIPDRINIPDLAPVKSRLIWERKTIHIPKVRRGKRPANERRPKISTICSFALKIKFLDKGYNAYFSVKFQN